MVKNSSSIKVNGEPASTLIHPLPFISNPSEPTAQGYDPHLSFFLSIQRLWSPGDLIELEFDMPITLRRAHPKVKGHRDKVAVTRGPLVYCLESTDNPGVDITSARLESSSLTPEPAPDLLGGITILRGQTVEVSR